MVKSINDFNGDGTFSISEEEKYQEVTISDVEYANNPGKKVKIFLKDGDSFESIRKIIEHRRIMPEHVEKTARETKAVSSAMTALYKLVAGRDGNNDAIIKKIKSTLLKLSVDDDFNYRLVADTLRDKATDINVDLEAFEKVGFEITPEYINSVVINQTIYSLEEYSYIHPKIKLLIALANKTTTVGELEFEIE